MNRTEKVDFFGFLRVEMDVAEQRWFMDVKEQVQFMDCKQL